MVCEQTENITVIEKQQFSDGTKKLAVIENTKRLLRNEGSTIFLKMLTKFLKMFPFFVY